MNEGMVSSGLTRDPNSIDHFVTPEYAVEPLLEFIPAPTKCGKIWECTDGEGTSGISSYLRKKGYTVIDNTVNPMDFLEDEMPSKVMDGIDFIITNPPFNRKDQFLATCKYYTDKYPHLGWALLLPLTTLEGVWRGEFFRSLHKDFKMVVLNRRVEFTGGSVWFNCSWFGYRIGFSFHEQINFRDITKGRIE